MYETLMMLKPGQDLPPEKMEDLVRNICSAMGRSVERHGPEIIVRAGESRLFIEFNDTPSVPAESAELAEEYGIDCAHCTARYQMSGEENGEELELFNDALLITERLEELGLILLDQTEF